LSDSFSLLLVHIKIDFFNLTCCHVSTISCIGIVIHIRRIGIGFSSRIA
jgi:hypothetical protein